jgi:hypothetical protein
MSDRTVSWIVTAAFAGAITLLVVTGCASTPAPAKQVHKTTTKTHRKPAAAKPAPTHKVCGWADTGRWECQEAPVTEAAPEEEQWDEL